MLVVPFQTIELVDQRTHSRIIRPRLEHLVSRNKMTPIIWSNCGRSFWLKGINDSLNDTRSSHSNDKQGSSISKQGRIWWKKERNLERATLHHSIDQEVCFHHTRRFRPEVDISLCQSIAEIPRVFTPLSLQSDQSWSLLLPSMRYYYRLKFPKSRGVFHSKARAEAPNFFCGLRTKARLLNRSVMCD